MRAVASLAPLSIVFLSLAPSPGAGAVPFSHFQALPDTQLAAVQVKLTPLGRRGTPLLRFATGATAAWLDGRCACGSELPRITRVAVGVEDAVLAG